MQNKLIKLDTGIWIDPTNIGSMAIFNRIFGKTIIWGVVVKNIDDNEMLAYYTEDVSRRAIGIRNDEQFCFYQNGDTRCSIGRWISEDKYSEDMDNDKLGITASGLITQFPNCLPAEIVDLGVEFLETVQNFHDKDFYWDKDGLTELGEQNFDRIVLTYCN